LNRTYPLQFPNQLNQYLKLLASGIAPPTPPPSTGTSEKPPNPSANFLIVPIQRLVLFARMLKDFDAFSEDDKVNLLKGSAIEVIVWSSNTLFNPKTHTFTNYISRDQRAVMDEQIIPLDPLLIKLWGDELFNRTKTFLIAMCHLHVDEVTSTLLVPVILFSPDRSNIKDLDLVKRLQIKYVTLLQKYMNWRYGIEQTENIYPKLLLQIINIRALSLGHAEIIQKVMSTTSVDPLVKEVTVKEEVLNTSTTEKMSKGIKNLFRSTEFYPTFLFRKGKLHLRRDEPSLRRDRLDLRRDRLGLRRDRPGLRRDRPGLRRDRLGIRRDKPNLRRWGSSLW